MGSVLMLCVTSWNYDAAAAVAGSHSPETAKLLFPLRGEQARMLVFHIANEVTRSYSGAWEALQLIVGLGAAAALFLERRTRLYTIGIGFMLLVVIFEWLVILPQLNYIGSSVDMVPWKMNSPVRDQYWNLRAVFVAMECLKLLLGAGLAAALLIIRSRTQAQRTEAEDLVTTGARPESLRKTRTRSRSRSREHSTGT